MKVYNHLRIFTESDLIDLIQITYSQDTIDMREYTSYRKDKSKVLSESTCFLSVTQMNLPTNIVPPNLPPPPENRTPLGKIFGDISRVLNSFHAPQMKTSVSLYLVSSI